jgi:hypothetical protein
VLSLLYNIVRRIRDYCRIDLTDIETFKIILDSNHPKFFVFEGIYSNNDSIRNDSTHKDGLSLISKHAPLYEIELFFGNYNRPILLFVNTSNHALAEHNNNGKLWKFEFVADEEDCSILMGSMSYENLEHTFQSKYEVIYEIGKLIEKDDLLKDEEMAASRCICFAKRQYIF